MFRPTLKKYQPEIKAFIDKVSEKASEIQKEGMAAGASMAKDLGSAENMAKAAEMASSAQKAMDNMDKKDDWAIEVLANNWWITEKAFG